MGNGKPHKCDHVSHLCIVTQGRGGVDYFGGYLNYLKSNGFMPSLTNIFVVVVVFGVSGLGGSEGGERESFIMVKAP